MRKSLSILLCFVLFALVEFRLEAPIEADTEDSSAFDIELAMNHLQQIAKEPHYMGTVANDRVKKYILAVFNKMGIEAEVYIGHTERFKDEKYSRLARTENIIARIPGRSSTKAVLLAAHYDSVLKSPGAADDGHAIASMLEVARVLADQSHLNDIVFLLTDGEENGLLGAKAYVENHDLSDIGILLNYEARGNSGPSIAFEWSENNAWLVDQVSRVYKRPVGSSLSYEIYQKMPNDTDFSFLLQEGIQGVNHAFIDGFSYYHNPVDNPQNINPRSFYHAGENMLRAVQHFANLPMGDMDSSGGNASFFNFLGYLVHYPSSLDLWLLVAVALILAFSIYRIGALGNISWARVGHYVLRIVGLLIVIGLLGWLLEKLLFWLYPQYDVFYAGQFYNHVCYLISMLGWVVGVIHLGTRNVKQEDIYHFRIAFGLLLGVLGLGLYLLMPTAVYVIIIPVLALLVVTLISTLSSKNPTPLIPTILLGMIPVVLWTPLVYNLFLAFSLDLLFAPAVFAGIVLLAVFYLIPKLFTANGIMLILGVILVAGGFLWGHWTSKPTVEKPLPMSNTWLIDVDRDTSYFSTNNEDMYFGDIDWVAFAKKNKGSNLSDSRVRPSLARAYDYCGQDVTINDSLARVKLVHKAECYALLLQIQNSSDVEALKINDQYVAIPESSQDKFLVEVLGMARDSAVVEVIKREPNAQVELQLESRFLGVPEAYYSVFKSQGPLSVTKLRRKISL